ncbi:neural cell adhesion molecule L1.1-like [Anomaloglossus baeobatrachus]
MTMSCALPAPSLLICAAFSFLTSADAARISSPLPHQIIMNTSLQVVNPPMQMEILSVRWEHKGSPLVEYRNGNMTFHSPRAKMSLEQLAQGNISLVLTNITLNDSGNYTCLVAYGKARQFAMYALIIERSRIRILDLTPLQEKARFTSVRSMKKNNGVELVTATLGENVTLHCSFSINAVQEPSMLVVRWSKDGVTKYLSNTTCCNFQGYEISEQVHQVGRAPLQLVHVQEKDTGVYTCSIKYKTMEESLNTTLQIQGSFHVANLKTFLILKESSLQPRAIGARWVIHRLADHSVTLHCNFSTDAIQELSTLVVHWSKDGVTKYFSNTTCCNFQGFEISNQDLQEGRAPLKLVNVQEKDTGVYTCSIKYKTIEESLNTILQVQDIPEQEPPEVCLHRIPYHQRTSATLVVDKEIPKIPFYIPHINMTDPCWMKLPLSPPSLCQDPPSYGH